MHKSHSLKSLIKSYMTPCACVQMVPSKCQNSLTEWNKLALLHVGSCGQTRRWEAGQTEVQCWPPHFCPQGRSAASLLVSAEIQTKHTKCRVQVIQCKNVTMIKQKQRQLHIEIHDFVTIIYLCLVRVPWHPSFCWDSRCKWCSVRHRLGYQHDGRTLLRYLGNRQPWPEKQNKKSSAVQHHHFCTVNCVITWKAEAEKCLGWDQLYYCS